MLGEDNQIDQLSLADALPSFTDAFEDVDKALKYVLKEIAECRVMSEQGRAALGALALSEEPHHREALRTLKKSTYDKAAWQRKAAERPEGADATVAHRANAANLDIHHKTFAGLDSRWCLGELGCAFGKSTLATAYARFLARKGGKVLILNTTPWLVW